MIPGTVLSLSEAENPAKFGEQSALGHCPRRFPDTKGNFLTICPVPSRDRETLRRIAIATSPNAPSQRVPEQLPDRVRSMVRSRHIGMADGS